MHDLKGSCYCNTEHGSHVFLTEFPLRVWVFGFDFCSLRYFDTNTHNLIFSFKYGI